jgi:hypothetical protein
MIPGWRRSRHDRLRPQAFNGCFEKMFVVCSVTYVSGIHYGFNRFKDNLIHARKPFDKTVTTNPSTSA